MESNNTENNTNIEQTERENERQHFLNTPERFREIASKLYPDLAEEIENENINESNEEETEESEESSEGIPGEYQFDLPDGFVVNEANIEKISTTFKEMNLTNDQAQKLISMEAEYIKEIQQSQVEEYNNTIEEWRSQSIKELGPNYKNEIPHGIKFRDTFFSKETVQLLDSIGILNHPLIVKDFINGGKKLNEIRSTKETNYNPKKPVDQVINSRKSIAQALYPNHP